MKSLEKQQKRGTEGQLIELVSAFCREKLNKEYEQVCIKLILKLGRKRAVPFLTGKATNWSAAIIYTIGTINYLFDRSFDPYIPSSDIHDYFGTKSTTVSAKASKIRKMLNIDRENNEFVTSRMIDDNLLDEFEVVDNMLVPILSLTDRHPKIKKGSCAKTRGDDTTSL